METKEKALELVNKYHKGYDLLWDLTWIQAKLCASITVDEIISANPHSNPLNTDVYSTMDYWQEVKQEIEKL